MILNIPFHRAKGESALRLRLSSENGGTLVETALSLSLLFMLIFGIIQISLVLYTYHFISEAAREATRYAVVRGSSLTTDCTAPGYATCVAQGGNNTGDIATYVTSLGYPGFDSSNISVNSTWLTSTEAACGTTDACKAPGDMAKVTVIYNFPFSVPFLHSRTLTMSSTSQMVISH